MFKFAAALGASAALAANGVEQVHLTPSGAADSVSVDFVTHSGQSTSCNYGPDASLANTVAATSQNVELNGWKATMNQAEMTGLAANTAYFYKCGSAADGYSQVFNFTHAPTRQRYALYADFGLVNDQSLPSLIKDSAAGGFDYVVHAGDWAYDLDTLFSSVGNDFMNGIQPYAATHPMLGSPGNHEAYGSQGGGAFNQFASRFESLRMFAGARSGSNSSFWYSVNIGLVHWIAFTAETWTMSQEQLAQQAAWIAADLATVDRSVTPWVMSFSHKWFQMDETTADLFNFMGSSGIDMHFTGHWHQYTRYPSMMNTGMDVTIDTDCLSADQKTYTNCKYPIAVVVGAPGDQELDPKTCSEQWQINCSGNYGYAHMDVMNATHVHWRWDTVTANGGPADWADEFYVVKA